MQLDHYIKWYEILKMVSIASPTAALFMGVKNQPIGCWKREKMWLERRYQHCPNKEIIHASQTTQELVMLM